MLNSGGDSARTRLGKCAGAAASGYRQLVDKVKNCIRKKESLEAGPARPASSADKRAGYSAGAGESRNSWHLPGGTESIISECATGSPFVRSLSFFSLSLSRLFLIARQWTRFDRCREEATGCLGDFCEWIFLWESNNGRNVITVIFGVVRLRKNFALLDGGCVIRISAFSKVIDG